MNVVRAFMGSEWLEASWQRQPPPEKRHPLILCWDAAKEVAGSGDDALAQCAEAASLITLGGCLAQGQRHSVFDPDVTRRELTDPKQFPHEQYVLQVADWYVRLGHRDVKMNPGYNDITIQSSGTPVYLECKKKEPLPEAELRMSEIWGRMYDLMNEKMDEVGVNAIVWVDALSDPTEDDLRRVAGTLGDMLKKRRDMKARLHDNKYVIEVRLTPPPGVWVSTAGLAWKPWGEFEQGTSAM